MSPAGSPIRFSRFPSIRSSAIALLLALTILGPAAALLAVRTVPITMTATPTAVSPGQNITISVTVQEVPSGGGSVQVGCSRPDLISSPSGSWPYTLQFPQGSSTTRSFTATAGSSLPNATVNFYSCPSDEDLNDPNTWTAQTSVATVTGGSGGM